ncbi:class I SAM-dependent methyltransferase [Brachybacterium huguangmaarense]
MTTAPEIDWREYNVSAAGRPASRRVARVMSAFPGDGTGRVVLEIGAGGGADALEFARHGWNVFAFDLDDTLASRLVENERMPGTVFFRHGDVREVVEFPAADAVYAAYSLPMLGDDLPVVWERLRAAIRPGGVIAVDLFGDRDTWVDREDIATLSDGRIDEMFEGFDILRRDVRDEDGRTFSGDRKHWHVHSIVARARR